MAVALGSAQIEEAFARMTPSGAFSWLETRLAERPEAEHGCLRSLALAVLKAHIATGAAAREWIGALFEASAAYLHEGKGLDPSRDTHAPIQSLPDELCALMRGALGLLSPPDRVALLHSILPALPDLSLACLLLRGDADDQLPDDMLGPAAAELRAVLLARVEMLAAERRLWQQGLPAAVLWFWWSFAQDGHVYRFVQTSMADGQSLVPLLDMIVEPGGPGTGGTALVAVRRWSKIVDFSRLEQAALQLALSGTTREDRQCARRFLDAFGNGKSELFR